MTTGCHILPVLLLLLLQSLRLIAAVSVAIDIESCVCLLQRLYLLFPLPNWELMHFLMEVNYL